MHISFSTSNKLFNWLPFMWWTVERRETGDRSEKISRSSYRVGRQFCRYIATAFRKLWALKHEDQAIWSSSSLCVPVAVVRSGLGI